MGLFYLLPKTYRPKSPLIRQSEIMTLLCSGDMINMLCVFWGNINCFCTYITS